MTGSQPEILPPVGAEPTAATLREGRYVVLGVLGSGSQGDTLDAVDKLEGRPVAIKRFMIRGAKSWKDVELAEREASVLSGLSHPALPRYVEHFEQDGALYLVMEKIEGETLAARRARGARLDQAQVLRFLRESAECLRYLHSQAPPIVHRDIKPGNVILRPDGSYCLVDFGSVRDRLKPEGGSTVVGTFGYMAPEQFQGRAAPGSDVYAVGATAIGLLSGCEPEDLPHKGLAIDVESALGRQLDRRLVGLLRSLVEPDPERRAPSLHQALSQFGLLGDEVHSTASPAEAAKRARRARLEAEEWGRDASERAWQHQSRSERQREREARRRAERDERRFRKAARRAERRARHRESGYAQQPGRPVPPGIMLGIFILVALRVAAIATFALFQLLLPTLFTLLALVGGTRMYRRGRRMLEIGQAGQRGLDRAGRHIRYQLLGGPEPEPSYAVHSPPGSPPTEGAPDAGRTRVRVEARERAASESESLEAKLEASAEALAAEAEAEARATKRTR